MSYVNNVFCYTLLQGDLDWLLDGVYQKLQTIEEKDPATIVAFFRDKFHRVTFC